MSQHSVEVTCPRCRKTFYLSHNDALLLYNAASVTQCTCGKRTNGLGWIFGDEVERRPSAHMEGGLNPYTRKVVDMPEQLIPTTDLVALYKRFVGLRVLTSNDTQYPELTLTPDHSGTLSFRDTFLTFDTFADGSIEIEKVLARLGTEEVSNDDVDWEERLIDRFNQFCRLLQQGNFREPRLLYEGGEGSIQFEYDTFVFTSFQEGVKWVDQLIAAHKQSEASGKPMWKTLGKRHTAPMTEQDKETWQLYHVEAKATPALLIQFFDALVALPHFADTIGLHFASEGFGFVEYPTCSITFGTIGEGIKLLDTLLNDESKPTDEQVSTQTPASFPLVEHAERELRLAGMFNADADYGGAIAKAVMDVVRVYAAQQHSGGSHVTTFGLLEKLLRFQALTPLTSDPTEWNDVSEMSGEPLWQNIRQSTTFSRDGGKTWYDIEEKPADNVNEAADADLLADINETLDGYEADQHIGYADRSPLERLRAIVRRYQDLTANALSREKTTVDDVIVYLRAFSLLVESVGNAGTHREKEARLRGMSEMVESAIDRLRKHDYDVLYASPRSMDIFRSDYPVRHFKDRIHGLEVEVNAYRKSSDGEDLPF